MTAPHIIASDGFGHMVHRHPHTGELWTAESARKWRRACAGSSRSGGIWIEIAECNCTEPTP